VLTTVTPRFYQPAFHEKLIDHASFGLVEYRILRNATRMQHFTLTGRDFLNSDLAGVAAILGSERAMCFRTIRNNQVLIAYGDFSEKRVGSSAEIPLHPEVSLNSEQVDLFYT
jgi:hypothetical protein